MIDTSSANKVKDNVSWLVVSAASCTEIERERVCESNIIFV